MFFARRLAAFCTVRRIVTVFLCLFAAAALSLAVVAWENRADPVPSKLERESENTKKNIVSDVTELYPIQTQGIVVPHTIEEIVAAVKSHDHVSIGGGRNSMGGQTASTRAVQIDMREYNKVLSFSTSSKEITVQTGIRWYDVQKYIDPYDLSVQIMQTYSNFTVGGSLSVNVHGRYIGQGPMIMSIRSFRIVLADGTIVDASPSERSDIFYSVIGGLGGIGVVTDVTLGLADNVHVERATTLINTEEYAKYFNEKIRSNPDVIFENGDMYPPAFKHVSVVTWSRTDKAPTVAERLIPRPRDYWRERIAWVVMSEWPFGRQIREYILEPWLYSGEAPVHTRNYEASYDIAELEPRARDTSTYVLQEYFVPVERFDEWVPKMKQVFDDFDVNVLNVSIRHAKQDPGSILAWAQKESFAFVVYYKQGTDERARADVAVWTRAMIDAVLSVDGRYYLPYQPVATDQQFHRAYPGAITYFEIKKKYDPTDKFTNNLWDTYYSDEKLAYFKEKKRVLQVASTTREYYRNLDNTFLTIPEWYIVYSADEYAAVLRDALPSKFPYTEARNEYWRQHATVIARTATSTADNSGYMQVLSVIGWSFSVENAVKGIYEHTIGLLSEKIAGDRRVPEDDYAASVAQQYADFIYDYPWYDFPYAKALAGLWRVQSTETLTWGQTIRRVERKINLSAEYSIKAGYSSIIAYLTHTKFGVQDDIDHAVITRDGGTTFELISAPHYQPFTRLLLETLAAERGNAGFSIVDIAGNDTIALTYRDATGARVPPMATEILREPQIDHLTDGKPQYVDRITVQLGVRDIATIYRDLTSRGVTIDHFYDY